MANDLTLINHSGRAHSDIGGSSAKRVMNCTASVELCAQYPNRESEFAQEGTACHEAIDLILQGKLEHDSDVIGLTFNGILMTDNLYLDGVAEALNTFDALDRELGGIEYLNEQQVTFPNISTPVRDDAGNIIGFEPRAAFGTVDIVGRAKDRAIVLDWKFGRGVAVEAEGNEQLMYYAYAAANTPGTAQFFDRDKPIELFIVQPMVKDGEPFTRWITTYNQLEVFALELRKAVEKAYSPEAEFKMGPWCQFCNAKPGCPLYRGKVQQIGAMTNGELRDSIADWLPYADQMIAWGEDIKKLAHGLLEQGEQIPGYKLVNKRMSRSWRDEAKTMRFFQKIGLPAADRHVKKLISPAQAEAALKKNGLPAELPDVLVDKTSSGTTLAPESDKRPAVQITANAFKLLAERLSAR